MSGSLCPWNSVVESKVAKPYLSPRVLASSLDRVSYHLLESTDLLLTFFLCPLTCPRQKQRQRRAFSSCHSRHEKCFSRLFCSKYRNTFVFQVWCNLTIHLVEKYLECAETALVSAVLTVEADGNKIYPELSRRVASSSR